MTQQQPPAPKDLSPSQKSMMRKVKIGIGIAAIIIIIVIVAVFAYVSLMNKGDLQFINFSWNDNHPWFSSAYIHVEETIFNSGSTTARDVQLVIRIYDSQEVLLKTETMSIGDIAGKEYKNISTDIQYSGDANRVETALTYHPF